MYGSHNIRRVDPAKPEPDVIQKAALILQRGGVVIIPTSGLYGLGADALNPRAVASLFKIKGRPARKPILSLIHSRNDIHRLVPSVPETARRFMDAFWPGRITLILKARKGLPPGLTAGTGKIGVRMCGHPVAAAVIEAFGGPVTGTSANLSGNEGCRRIDDLPPELLEKAELILDAGELAGGVGSTILDVTIRPPVMIREGAVKFREIALQTRL